MNQKYLVPIVILVVAIGYFYLNLGSPTPEEYVNLSAVEASEKLVASPEVQVVDIRTPAEFSEGHIRGARMIDFYAPGYREKWAGLDRDATYFVYCRTGNRSSKTLSMLKELGFTRIWHLERGIVSWQRAGLPLVR